MKTSFTTLAAALMTLAAIAPTNLDAQTKKWDAIRAEQGLSLPTWAVKTNLLADLTTSMNLGFEVRTGGRTSLELVGQWNPWMFKNNARWQHWGVQPEFRVWTREAFRGHFFGLQAHYADYNVGGLPSGPFSAYMNENRLVGDLYGAGVSWGHRWNFSRRWGLEVTLAAGWAHKSYDRYECVSCGDMTGHTDKNYFGPTEIGVNLIFGGGSKKTAVVAPPPPPAPAPAPQPAPAPAPKPAPEPVREVPQAIQKAMMDLSDILFAFDRFNLTPEAVVELDKVTAWLRENPTVKVEIGGHTDSEGTTDYNLRLSESRARSVREYFTEHGVAAGRLTSKGYGESQPIATNDTPEGRRLNRRVELKIAD
jgi:outer membrane protein OmpA-like peptidoglycan-associated protein